MLATEKRDILSQGVDWEIPLPDPLQTRIVSPYTPLFAEKQFLERAKQLGIK
jgi:hypothetical protein